MLEAFKSLPEDPDELRAISVQMAQHIQSQAYQIEKLKAELHGHRKARFGAKSEAMDQLALDLSEDDEIAQAADAQQAEPSPGDEDPTAKRQHSRKPLPDHLDRQDEVLSPGEACTGCGGTLRQVGEDITQELDYIPGHFVVRRFIRPRMACTCCEAFAQAPLPSRLIERGRPGPGLVAHMLVGKYCDHLPLERQSKIYARADPMIRGGWMAWTFPVALFFWIIASLLVLFTILAIRFPETPRLGILRIETTRGDRLFITLLGSAFICLIWLFFFGAPVWWGLGLCFVYAAAVFRWV